MATTNLIKVENIQTILSTAPQSYNDNELSRQNCIKAGEKLLAKIQTEGMTDDLDLQIASFIEKARKTVKKMNERRSPVTKLFDDIRATFTRMENEVDYTKTGTIPFQLQALRNQYATQKREAEIQRQRAEAERQRAEAERRKRLAEIEDNYKKQLSSLIEKACKELTNIDNQITLQNFADLSALIDNFQTNLPANIFIARTQEEVEILNSILPSLTEQYEFEVSSTKQYFVERLPSKHTHLYQIEQANAEEAARMQEEMEERRRKEVQAQEEERRRKEEEEEKKAELARKQAEMDSLFTQQSIISEYQPKIKVEKKINLLNPEGIMPIISLWWSKEGRYLSTEELGKMFKKQITACEKYANKEDLLIKDESVEYVENVKAK